jgi:hypothetical protein
VICERPEKELLRRSGRYWRNWSGDDRNVIIQKGVTREVILPKENVEGFDGHEVFLNVTSEELKRHEIKI